MMTAINNKDYPVIEGCVLVLAALICLINLITDLVYSFVDPRIMAQYTGGGKKKKKGGAQHGNS
jgi:peptide/nickel transport system permease protein